MTATSTVEPATPAAPAPPSWRRLATDRVVLALVGLHVLVKLALFPSMSDARLTGDEISYTEGGMTLANVVRDLLHLRGVDLTEISQNIVGNGWFMPGSSVVLTPLYLVDSEPGIAVVRAYMGVFTTLLLLLTAAVVHRHLGRAYAVTLLVFPGLVPMWMLFSYTTWGDLTAGLLLVILLSLTVGFARDARRGRAPGTLAAVGFGVVAIASLYSRSSILPLLAGLFGLLTIGAVTLLRGAARRRGLRSVVVAALTFGALLAPWSVAASTAFDEPVVTTTTVPIALGVTFGERDQLCFGPCDRGNIWFTSVRYSREVSRVTGVGELVVQQQMSTYARRDLTAQHYAATVLGNTRRYLLHPTEFENRLQPDRDATLSRAIVTTSWAFYAVFLAGFVAALLVVRRRGFRDQVLSLLVKAFGAALLLQPFVHISHGRYWPTAAPLFAVATAFLVQLALTRRRDSDSPEDPADGGLVTRVLTWAQAAAAATLVLAAVVVMALAAS